MEIENSNSSGFVMMDYKDALLRWSKSWAELADGNLTQDSLKDTLKVEDLESDAGYASEGSYRFYVGSKSGSVGSLEDFDEEEEEDYVGRSDDVYDMHEDVDYVADADDVADARGDASNDCEDAEPDVSIEMIGSECVLVNGYQPDDLPCPCEATRDGMTPEVNLEYNHEDLVEVACRYLAYLGCNKQRPKIYWAMKYAPEFEDDSDNDSDS